MTDTTTQLTTGIGAVWAAVSVLAGVALMAYVKVNQAGPRAFWATDACPEPSAVCGNVPLVLLPSALLAAGLVAAGAPVVVWLDRRVGGGATDG